jgi:hypothetical protein
MITKEEEQLITNGDNAEVLLGTEVFNQMINLAVDTAFTNFMNTKMEDKDYRERQFYGYRAVADLVNSLKQAVSVRDEINAKNLKDNNSQEEE